MVFGLVVSEKVLKIVTDNKNKDDKRTPSDSISSHGAKTREITIKCGQTIIEIKLMTLSNRIDRNKIQGKNLFFVDLELLIISCVQYLYLFIFFGQKYKTCICCHLLVISNITRQQTI